MESVGANAKVVYPGCNEIVIKHDAPKAALLEEFLHGTQEKLGIICAEIPLQVAEIHVKDFMIRHSKLLGLNSNDITLIQELKNREIKKLEKLGYRWIDE